MRIAVFSDTHGNRRDLRDALDAHCPVNMVLHLGDGVLDGYEAAVQSGIEFQGVAGNGDFGTAFPGRSRLEIKGWNILLTHGQEMDLNAYYPEDVWRRNLREMAVWAKERGADMLLFGHAHRPVLETIEGVILLNPGDQYPGPAGTPTFALLEWTKNHLAIQIKARHASGWRKILEMTGRGASRINRPR
ncbi:MAG: YfcE family phosphodiesterase [Syntrophales bacterium]|nr:YfcE family phosphodiesterase [Syntrophales bacterium]MDD5531768.1 YfcE family phosphodiesterase [Syntrophales bacterium]HPL64498.1 YfcE family phosphodiesterase [Syntrophales bacterium]